MINIFYKVRFVSQLKRTGSTGPTALESDGPYFENETRAAVDGTPSQIPAF